jgi:hypothetical protein
MRAHRSPGWIAVTAFAVALVSSVPAAAGAAAARSPGFFRSHCTYSHTAPDDPILLPRAPGSSMVHDFFGNTSTSAFSTATTLRAVASTSCLAPADASAYWFPALYQDGRRILPRALTAYYRTAGRPADSIQPMPAGLEMIAGNETSLTPQSTNVAYWNCGAKAGVQRTATPPARCPAGTQLVLSLVFPDCWDGHTLAGATQRNVAYAVRGRCPAGYDVAIPRLVVHVRYPLRDGTRLTLSMGPTMQTMPNSIYTAHADFVNAWDQSVLGALVAQCNRTNTRCGTVGPANAPLGVVR